MGAKIPYTSGTDLFVHFFIGLPLMILTMIGCGSVIHSLLYFLNISINADLKEWIVGLSGIFLGGWIYVKYVGIYVKFLSAYMYIRFELFTPVSWQETRSLCALFVLTEDGKWFPCEEVKKLLKKNEKNISLILHRKQIV